MLTSTANPESTTVLYIHHRTRDPLAHVARRTRPGNRQGFLLENGRRLRMRGKRSFTTVTVEDIFKNLEKILMGVKDCYITVARDGDGQEVLGVEELKRLFEKPVEQSEPLTSVEPPTEKAPWVPEELLKMSRADLNNLAFDEFGIESPEKYPNKGELISVMLGEEE